MAAAFFLVRISYIHHQDVGFGVVAKEASVRSMLSELWAMKLRKSCATLCKWETEHRQDSGDIYRTFLVPVWMWEGLATVRLSLTLSYIDNMQTRL